MWGSTGQGPTCQASLYHLLDCSRSLAWSTRLVRILHGKANADLIRIPTRYTTLASLITPSSMASRSRRRLPDGIEPQGQPDRTGYVSGQGEGALCLGLSCPYLDARTGQRLATGLSGHQQARELRMERRSPLTFLFAITVHSG